MNDEVERIVRHYTRIDPRSLGLFRVLFGLALIGDWMGRWRERIAFYSNDGVLPNHYHLFLLKGKGRFVWSALHAFSTPGEASVALVLILLFYFFFTIGFRTRIFHVLSLVGLVSLVARNTLASGPGDALAIILLGATMFLPCGSRFSLDSVLATARAARESKPKHLLDMSNLPTEDDIRRAHAPGWSPRSIAATGTLLLLCLVLLSLGKQQSGASWKDGTALHRALHVFMIASPRGFAWRDSGVLGPLTRLLSIAQTAVPALLVVPVLRGATRGAAAALLAIYGLTYALLTTFTLFGWCFVAAAALVLSQDTWEKWAKKHDPRRRLTVIFDVDCGICFWLVKMLRRYDARRHMVFMGNGEFPLSTEEPEAPAFEEEGAPQREAPVLPPLLVWDKDGKRVVEKEMPKGITSKLVESTVVAVRADGSFATRGGAVVEILRALPGLTLVALLLDVPFIRGIRDWFYDEFAKRRTKVSVELGLAACGVLVATKEVPLKPPVPPSTATRYFGLGALREIGAALFIAAIAIQTTQLNGVGPRVGTNALEPITWWTRAIPRWDVLAPEPPAQQSALVVDAVTKNGRKLDVMTGTDPTISFDRPFSLGPLWANYLLSVSKEENKSAQEWLRKYFARRGPRYEPAETTQILQGADGYWLTGAPSTEVQGDAADGGGEPKAERWFRHGRGGGTLTAVIAPLLPAGTPGNLRPPREPAAPRGEPDLEDEEQRKPEPLRFPEHPEPPPSPESPELQ